MKLRWRRMCAALGIFLGLNLVAAKWAKAHVSGALEARGLEFGRQLYEASGLMTAFEGESSYGGSGSRAFAGGAQRLLVNGAEIALHSGSMRLSSETNLNALVAKVRDNCRSPRKETVTEEALVQAPLLEWVGETEAFVYCLKSERPLSLEALSELLQAFNKSGDLSEWGTFQGAYFRVQERSINIVTAEIKRGLAPVQMFPEDRDAPGGNIAALPAPKGRRVLSVAHGGKPALTIHQSSGDAKRALNLYQERLMERGLSVERAKMERGDSLALVARSAREAFVVVAQELDVSSAAEAGGSQIVLARLPD